MAEKILLYPELETWLRRATEDLIPEAAASVREEIARHFEDAVQQRIDDGINEIGAIDLAIRDLGSPRRARRRLRKEWLTLSEAKTLRGMAEKYASFLGVRRRFRRIILAFALIWAVVAIFYAFQISIRQETLADIKPLIQGVLSISLLLVAYYGLRSFPFARTFDRFVASEIIETGFSWLAMIGIVATIGWTGAYRNRLLANPRSWTIAEIVTIAIMAFMVFLKWAGDVGFIVLWLKYRRIRKKGGTAFDAME